MQAHQSNPSQGLGPHFRTPQVRTQSPPHRTLAEAPGCLWSAFTSSESPRIRPYATICDHIRPSASLPGPRRGPNPKSKIKNSKATISDLQHPCVVERCRSPQIQNLKSKIKNSNNPINYALSAPNANL